MISSNLSIKEQIVVRCHGVGQNSTFHDNENILSTHVEKEDFFASLVAPRLPVIGLISVFGVALLGLLPLSLWICRYEQEANRTQTLITRINSTIVAMLMVVVLPPFLIDSLRFYTGICYPPLFCYIHMICKVLKIYFKPLKMYQSKER